ncbi:Pur-alpha [Operophtera brumata]|uniref:Pur-alpha n=1 Tax=Operophtera brumata TaxID=104452 RepID=A0A0L7L4C2_OPEBR|nr:Pur-alpha [Operophtera brumata]
MLQIQSKRFYLDVKQNRRGRFIKVAEIGADGRRSQIFLAMSTAAEFRDHLSSFSDYYSSLGPPNPENVPEDGKLKSEMMLKDNRRYYLDLKENSRGRFLRVSQTLSRGGPRSQDNRRYYLDLKENSRGRFLRVSQTLSRGGPRSQVALYIRQPALLPVSEGELARSLPARIADAVARGAALAGRADNRRYYLDLKENSRGRFLRVSQTLSRGGPRSQVALPAQGMIEFRDALTDLLDDFGADDAQYKGELPEGRHLRVDNKNFYFDIGQNNRGIYMKVSEVKSNFRTAITVPEKCWGRFRDILNEYCEKMTHSREARLIGFDSRAAFLADSDTQLHTDRRLSVCHTAHEHGGNRGAAPARPAHVD